MNTDGIMKPYMKDFNGDPGCPINGQICGLFFAGKRDRKNGCLPTHSPFGEYRFVVPTFRLFNPFNLNMYFADFYCHTVNHYVTVVLTHPGSQEDVFCMQFLKKLNTTMNPFFMYDVDSDRYWMASKIYVEVFYTLPVYVAYEMSIDPIRCQIGPTNVIGRGYSKVEGIVKNPNCSVCNLYTNKRKRDASVAGAEQQQEQPQMKKRRKNKKKKTSSSSASHSSQSSENGSDKTVSIEEKEPEKMSTASDDVIAQRHKVKAKRTLTTVQPLLEINVVPPPYTSPFHVAQKGSSTETLSQSTETVSQSSDEDNETKTYSNASECNDQPTGYSKIESVDDSNSIQNNVSECSPKSNVCQVDATSDLPISKSVYFQNENPLETETFLQDAKETDIQQPQTTGNLPENSQGKFSTDDDISCDQRIGDNSAVFSDGDDDKTDLNSSAVSVDMDDYEVLDSCVASDVEGPCITENISKKPPPVLDSDYSFESSTKNKQDLTTDSENASLYSFLWVDVVSVSMDSEEERRLLAISSPAEVVYLNEFSVPTPPDQTNDSPLLFDDANNRDHMNGVASKSTHHQSNDNNGQDQETGRIDALIEVPIKGNIFFLSLKDKQKMNTICQFLFQEIHICKKYEHFGFFFPKIYTQNCKWQNMEI